MLNLQQIRYSIRHAIERWFEDPVTTVLARLKVTPSALTVLGLLLSGAAAYFAATGTFWVSGILVAGGALLDLLDGGLARKTGTASKQGALLDSTADRIQEGAILMGLLVYYVVNPEQPRIGAILSFVAFGGSLMVSYVRARAEGLGDSGTAGFFTRPERVAVTVIFLIIGIPLVALWILSIGAWLSALWRFFASWNALKK